ncbi:autotransporter outer membrane beta-barrel domain-containing protein [Rappaport israeli]|uniref:autotransporter outer membrane beta-barrel domain-containing protein n=1 Tax=Rappaport israeli TaxID=1839807 RepID=UPI00093075E1|nr:autotransporter outer membrane beta-barrel domain-containing protein [Rappaport israeli]
MKKLLISVIALCSISAFAQQHTQEQEKASLTAKASTLGLGVEYALPVAPKVKVGIGANYLGLKRDFTDNNLNLHAKAKLFTAGITGYYQPWDNGFNLNGGLFYNANRADLTGKAEQQTTGKTYTLNGEQYSANNIQHIKGSVDFNKIAPYIGIGYQSGNSSQEGWGFDANLGVMYQGTPKVSLSATCSNQLSATEFGQQVCTNLKNDLNAERNKLQNDINRMKFYPVTSVGVIYRF